MSESFFFIIASSFLIWSVISEIFFLSFSIFSWIEEESSFDVSSLCRSSSSMHPAYNTLKTFSHTTAFHSFYRIDRLSLFYLRILFVWRIYRMIHADNLYIWAKMRRYWYHVMEKSSPRHIHFYHPCLTNFLYHDGCRKQPQQSCQQKDAWIAETIHIGNTAKR